jgi:uncharacterized protein
MTRPFTSGSPVVQIDVASARDAPGMRRRDFMGAGLAGSLLAVIGPSRLAGAAAPVVVGAGPYGPLGSPDPATGVRLPAGFTARLVAVTGRPVGDTGYVWHGEPDGGATFPMTDGGWVYVSNSETNGTSGGVGALRFGPDGSLASAYRILSGTKWNCAGGATPWGTWLSCEEFRQGRVWECDPTGVRAAVERRALGTFAHEAAVVDPVTRFVYLTEDEDDGRLYRFRPSSPHAASTEILAAGVLEAASVATAIGGAVVWEPVPATRPARTRTTTAFDRGEGAWFAGGKVWFTTTSSDRVWTLDTATDILEIVYDASAVGPDAPLREPDNITVHATSGDVFVAEDADDVQLVLLAQDGAQVVAVPFLQFVGHDGSEVTGPAFSPDGTRLYVSSQRGFDGDGMTFEITGPFRN